MKVTELSKYLSQFISPVNDTKAVLIDGAWGIGKTYAITEFCESMTKNKNYKVYYHSLFGCPNIDVLHKQLYSKFHPAKTRSLEALSCVSLALNLSTIVGFGTGINTEKMAEIISSNTSNKLSNQSKRTNIIIFDDLERIATDAIKIEDLMGYFNRLRLENIKVVVLCDKSKIEEEYSKKFEEFKEKVFDREIKIEECNEIVIEKFFGENYKYVSIKVLDLIDNNLRTAYKISIFFVEAKKYLQENKFEYDDEELMFICALIICDSFTHTISNEHKEYLDSRKDDKNFVISFRAKQELKEIDTDDFKINAIVWYAGNKNISISDKLVNSLYRLFVYFDNTSLNPVTDTEYKFYEDKVFYLSDTNKCNYISNKFDILYSNEMNFPDDQIVREIRSWLKYCPSFFTHEIMMDLINRLIKLSDTKKNRKLIDSFISYRHIEENDCPKLKQFYGLLDESYKKKLTREFVDSFYAVVKNIDEYHGQLYTLGHFIEDKRITIPLSLIDEINKNGFYIPNLAEDINDNKWAFCHSMCDFIINIIPEQKENLKNYLLSQITINPNSKCLTDRVNSLINYKIDKNIN